MPSSTRRGGCLPASRRAPESAPAPSGAVVRVRTRRIEPSWPPPLSASTSTWSTNWSSRWWRPAADGARCSSPSGRISCAPDACAPSWHCARSIPGHEPSSDSVRPDSHPEPERPSDPSGRRARRPRRTRSVDAPGRDIARRRPSPHQTWREPRNANLRNGRERGKPAAKYAALPAGLGNDVELDAVHERVVVDGSRVRGAPAKRLRDPSRPIGARRRRSRWRTEPSRSSRSRCVPRPLRIDLRP